jgi:hypothetical protein
METAALFVGGIVFGFLIALSWVGAIAEHRARKTRSIPSHWPYIIKDKDKK